MRCASFYVGSGLSPYLRTCLQSWADYGHEIELYTYDPELVLPPGVRRRDAAEVVASDRVFTYARGDGGGSVAAFANQFRYRLLSADDVTWVDTDVLCLSANWPEDAYLFGWETADREKCNNAVLRLPRDSAVLAALLSHATEADRSDLLWGATGPVLLTRLVHEMGLADHALPSDRLYPIHFTECRMFVDPALRAAADDRCARALAVHLWDEIWTRRRIPPFLSPPAGSFLADALARHHVTVPVAATYPDLSIFEYRAPVPMVPQSDYDEVAAWAKSMEEDLLARKRAEGH